MRPIEETNPKNSAPVNRCVRMIVPPVEPVVLDGRQRLQTFPGGASRYGAALEIPLAGFHRVHQQEIRTPMLTKELDLGTIQSAPKRAYRFSVRSGHQQHRVSAHPVLNRTLFQ